MKDSLFTKIGKGEIPCQKIYEDDLTLAFLDIYPVQPGHTLVIPKKQVEFVWDLPDEDYQAVMDTCKKVALRLREKMEPKYVHARVVGTDVPHAHVHLIPFNQTVELRREPDMSDPAEDSILAEIANKLKF